MANDFLCNIDVYGPEKTLAGIAEKAFPDNQSSWEQNRTSMIMSQADDVYMISVTVCFRWTADYDEVVRLSKLYPDTAVAVYGLDITDPQGCEGRVYRNGEMVNETIIEDREFTTAIREYRIGLHGERYETEDAALTMMEPMMKENCIKSLAADIPKIS